MILLIDNYDSFTHNLYQIMALLHAQVHIVRNDKITLEDIRQLKPSGIILSPGPGRPEDAGICVDLIRALLKGELMQVPLLGVCLGHQALTIALGGRVVASPHICHGKQDLMFHQQSGLYHSLPMPFQAGRYHSLVTERSSLPSSLIIEAENKEKLVMGIRHHALSLYGVQFHPESILTPEGKTLLQSFLTGVAA